MSPLQFCTQAEWKIGQNLVNCKGGHTQADIGCKLDTYRLSLQLLGHIQRPSDGQPDQHLDKNWARTTLEQRYTSHLKVLPFFSL